ncbi:MAG: GNAT family N-acetyltransferase [Gemmatimonadetes bacterium]|nr:GNAT family N-acetyltransferase [Gemmatimonadota bacterium]
MNLFEEYRPERPSDAAPVLADLRIRPAVPADAPALGALEASREGGDPAARARDVEHSIHAAATDHRTLILVAEHERHLLALAKARHFLPPAASPPSVAPPGWYLSGVIVSPEWRRRGIGRALTRARLDRIAEHASVVYYFANARNRVSIELHRPFGFKEVTRDFTFPGVTFEGGVGMLFRADQCRRRAGSH